MGWYEVESRGSLRSRLAGGESLLGSFQRIPAPAVTELLALAGFDFVILDMEHTAIALERVGDLVRAAEAAGLEALVRVPSGEPWLISRALETGCMGVVVPLVRSAADAAAAVRATRFAPRGGRGLAASRHTGYGVRMSLPDWIEATERHTLMVAQVEDRDGVAAAEAIASTDGVDVVFVGLTDLTLDLGLVGEYEAPEVKEAIATVARAVERAGKVLGLPAGNAEAAARNRASGARFSTCDDIRILLSGAQAFVQAVRSAE